MVAVKVAHFSSFVTVQPSFITDSFEGLLRSKQTISCPVLLTSKIWG